MEDLESDILVCADKISTAKLVRKVKEIVNRNPDIHVWNLSLGTEDEISKNFISYDAAFLDELQAKKISCLLFPVRMITEL